MAEIVDRNCKDERGGKEEEKASREDQGRRSLDGEFVANACEARDGPSKCLESVPAEA